METWFFLHKIEHIFVFILVLYTLEVASFNSSTTGCVCASDCEIDKKTGDSWCFVDNSQCGLNGCVCQDSAGGTWDTCVHTTTSTTTAPVTHAVTTPTTSLGKSGQCCFYSTANGGDEYCSASDEAVFTPWEYNDKFRYAQIADGCETVIYAAISWQAKSFYHGSGWWDFSGLDVDGPGKAFVSSFKCSCDGSTRLQQGGAPVTGNVPTNTNTPTGTGGSSTGSVVSTNKQCCFYEHSDHSGGSMCTQTDMAYVDPWELNDKLQFASISQGCETVIYAAINFLSQSAYHGDGDWDFSRVQLDESGHVGPNVSSVKCDCTGSGRLKHTAAVDCSQSAACESKSTGSEFTEMDVVIVFLIVLSVCVFVIVLGVLLFAWKQQRDKQRRGRAAATHQIVPRPHFNPVAIGRQENPVSVSRPSPTLQNPVAPPTEPEGEYDVCPKSERDGNVSSKNADRPGAGKQTTTGTQSGDSDGSQLFGCVRQQTGDVAETEPEELP
eukprot:GDKI01011669.1.p1 GENE.GDKI01011669.1~~GDKI01011669.1.p1  ORF type:complete len:495 (+),score=66.01 GDKI01011669.1:97-1581(+)